MALAAFRCFSAVAAMAAGLAASALAWRAGRNAPCGRPATSSLVGLVLLLATALWFRTPPALNTVGGYDPGLYAAMAMNIARSGDIDITDRLHATLDASQRALYEAHLVAGVICTDSAASKFQMPFYPMNSVWLALFIQTGGPNAAPWGLVLAGLLVVLGTGALAHELAGGRTAAGWMAAAFAAVHPGFILLSRFPVSEGLALALTLNAAALLARAWRRSRAGHPCRNELIVALLLLNAFFYARMTGLFLVPFLVGALLLAVPNLPKADRSSRHAGWYVFTLALVATWGLSTAFYAVRMPTLFGPIMDFMLAPLRDHFAPAAVAGCFGLASLLWLHFRRPEFLAAAGRLAARLAPWALPTALALTLWPVYVAWTRQGLPASTNYAAQEMAGVALYTHTLPFRLALHLSPLFLLLLALAPLVRRRPEGTALPVLMLFFAYMTLLTVASPYAFLRGSPFYMDRYYLSELAPCGLVVASVLCASLATAGRRARIAVAALAVAVFVFFAFAAKPLRDVPIGEARSFLEETARSVRPDDLVFFVMDPPPPHLHMKDSLQTPLAYWVGLRVFPIHRSDLARPAVQKLARNQPHAYVLAVEPLGERSGEERLRLVGRAGYDVSVPFTPAEAKRILSKVETGWRAWLDLPRVAIRMRGKMLLYTWETTGGGTGQATVTP